ncbi:MAG: hypothetical protein L3K26_04835, partial [Candidatus Hydrogenedentes bacterium]|nr:hypothetical protein [Candidatus Hydrogenedentota bacterium]
MGNRFGSRTIVQTFLALVVAGAMCWNARAADFLVTNTSDSGPGTLREAMTQADSNGEADMITFNFGSPSTFAVTTPLPPLTEGGTTIDGGDVVILDGGDIVGRGIGFIINSANNVLENMATINFPGDGITILGTAATSNRGKGCRIGTDGNRARADGRDGIRIGFG